MFTSNFVFSQDLIVTNEGDSLNCVITKVKDQFIFFTFKQNNEVKNTMMATNQVKFYAKNFYKSTTIPQDKVLNNTMYPHFRLAINGGFSQRLGRIPSSYPTFVQEYFTKLKTGSNIGVDATYFVAEKTGIGIVYNAYNSQNEIDIYVTDSLDNVTYGKMADNIKISFIGPAIHRRHFSKNNKSNFYFNFSIGELSYRNYATFIDDFSIKGKTVGINLMYGCEFNIADDLALGFQLSYLTGVLSHYYYTKANSTQHITLNARNYENLTRVDFSVGLRINL